MEYKNIFKQVKQIVQHCNKLPSNVPLDMSNWEYAWHEGKEGWINLMPDTLRVELPEPVTFTIDKSEKHRMYDNFLVHDLLEEDYPQLQDFLMSLGYDEFFGKYLKEEYSFNDEDDDFNEVIIPKGTKIIKAFKFFHVRDDDLKTLQSEASRLIQQDSITGRLCLSVHPLDYLSLSENVSNWRSCHSLDGIYAAGNLSYMFDSSTVIVYLRSEKNVQLPNFPEGLLWNNKKWRMLLHFDDLRTMVFTSKQYPFTSTGAYNHITKLINQAIKPTTKWFTKFSRDFLNTTNTNKKLLEEHLIYVGHCARPLGQIVKQHKNNLAYTDLLFAEGLKYRWAYANMSYYLLYNEDDEYNPPLENDTGGFDSENSTYLCSGITNSDTKIILGYSVICPICNKEIIYEGDTMICPNCEEALFPEHIIRERRKERNPYGYF